MDYFDLGNHSRKISTQSAKAQMWFDRGLIWIYGYNHEEAISCFEHTLNEDPGCAMAHWGIAYAIGPNYNKPWEAFEEDERPAALARANAAIEAASLLANQLMPIEKALIDALATRYPKDTNCVDLSSFNDAFANAMREVNKNYPDDLDILCICVEALMNRTPWALWDLATGKAASDADTLEAKAALDSAFLVNPDAWAHPGLLHMYIHLMEMSPTPELALRHGDALISLVPDAGHLQHMPTHIDVLCGDYQSVVERNESGIIADRKYLAEMGANNFYSVYRCHNYHFKIYGAMFLGQPTIALAAAEELIATMSDDFLREMADWFEGFVPMKQHVLVRFGRWKEILAQTLPEDSDLYAVTTAMMHYARTVALANTKDIVAAVNERALFDQSYAAVPETRMLFNNTCRDILAVGEQMMLGELAYHQGKSELAFEHLNQSVELDDSLPYDEPWGWMQPTRHALGALLIEQGLYDQAEAVYRADLGLDSTLSRACQHPVNVWSLHGLYECLIKRGETTESQHIKQQLDRALARAEVSIHASCYCRQVELQT
jgi:tetratricopeptide (TPR) repeat protein